MVRQRVTNACSSEQLVGQAGGLGYETVYLGALVFQVCSAKSAVFTPTMTAEGRLFLARLRRVSQIESIVHKNFTANKAP